mgnify:CR=1 FL=1
MTSQFSPKVSEILAYSREEAARLASSSVAPEHLLLGLLRMKDGPVIDVFRRLNVDLRLVKAELEDRVKQNEVGQPINTSELVLNEKASNILKLAVLEARIQHLQRVDEQHILLAILHDNVNNGAKEILEQNDMTYDDVYALLQQKSSVNDGIGLPDEDEYEEANQDDKGKYGDRQQGGQQPTTQTRKPGGKTPVLDNFGTDLTQAAAEGKLDPVVGHSPVCRCWRRETSPYASRNVHDGNNWPQEEKQPNSDWRARCWKERHSGRAGTAYCKAADVAGAFREKAYKPRHDRHCGRDEIPRAI